VNIYVGNLSRDTEEDALRKVFEGFGQVDTCNIVKDKFSGDSRGLGFVEMPNQDEATAAINGLNNYELDGRTITVNEARPKTDRPRRGSGPRRGGGQRRGGSGGRGGFGHNRGDRRDNRWGSTDHGSQS